MMRKVLLAVLCLLFGVQLVLYFLLRVNPDMLLGYLPVQLDGAVVELLQTFNALLIIPELVLALLLADSIMRQIPFSVLLRQQLEKLWMVRRIRDVRKLREIRTNLWMLGCVFLAVSLFLPVVLYNQTAAIIRFNTSAAVQAQGQVIGRSRPAAVYYEFVAQDGRTYQGRFYNKNSRLRKGDQAEVVYFPGDPAQNMYAPQVALHGAVGIKNITWLCGLLLLDMLCLFLGWVTLRKARKYGKLLSRLLAGADVEIA